MDILAGQQTCFCCLYGVSQCHLGLSQCRVHILITCLCRFMAFDRHMNLVLGDAEEFRKLPPKKGRTEEEVRCSTPPYLLYKFFTRSTLHKHQSSLCYVTSSSAIRGGCWAWCCCVGMKSSHLLWRVRRQQMPRVCPRTRLLPAAPAWAVLQVAACPRPPPARPLR